MDELRAGAEKVLEDPRTSCYVRKSGNVKKK